jgi:hypothetical protein
MNLEQALRELIGKNAYVLDGKSTAHHLGKLTEVSVHTIGMILRFDSGRMVFMTSMYSNMRFIFEVSPDDIKEKEATFRHPPFMSLHFDGHGGFYPS